MKIVKLKKGKSLSTMSTKDKLEVKEHEEVFQLILIVELLLRLRRVLERRDLDL